MKAMRNILVVLALWSALVSTVQSQQAVVLLEPVHRARFVDGVQVGVSVSDSSARVTLVSASVVRPLYFFLQAEVRDALGTGSVGAALPTLGLAYVPFSLGPLHLSGQAWLARGRTAGVTGLLGIAARLLQLNLGARVEWADAASVSGSRKRAAYFGNLAVRLGRMQAEVEVDGRLHGRPRWQRSWWRRQQRWHLGLSYEPFRRFYLSAMLRDVGGVRQRWLGITYVLARSE